MLVTFADSHSALSVLDVDGMKVSGSSQCPTYVSAMVHRSWDSPSGSCVLELEVWFPLSLSSLLMESTFLLSPKTVLGHAAHT